MTEVKKTPSSSPADNHLGLFATRDYAVGDMIVSEDRPLVQLAPGSEDRSRQLLLVWQGGGRGEEGSSSSTSTKRSTAGDNNNSGNNNDNKNKTTSTAAAKMQQHPHATTTTKGESQRLLWDAIDVTTTNTDNNNNNPGVFKGMVQAGLIWMMEYQQDLQLKEQLLKLYSPSLQEEDDDDDEGASSTDAERTCLKIADDAVAYLQAHPLPNHHHLEQEQYDDWDTLKKVVLVWSCNSFEVGRIYHQLSRVNHDCNPNAVIQSTGEQQRLVAATTIQAGDEITISYLGLWLYADCTTRRNKLRKDKFFDCQCHRCTAVTMKSSHGKEDPAARIPCPDVHPRQSPQFCLEEDVQYDDDQTVQYTTLSPSSSSSSSSFSSFSLPTKLAKVLENVCNKIQSYLDTYEVQGKNGTAPQPSEDGNNDKRDDNKQGNTMMILEEHVSLACTMMGDKHWTTNLLLLLFLDRRLSSMSQQMLTTQELPELDDVAECIDSLQRLWRYVEALELKLDPGHVLGDVTIGVARLLVSLGDEKSCKYATEWLNKVDDYVDQFGGDGLQKVVAALKVAWKKHDREDLGDSAPSTKKSKLN